jgi:hypothetical protein
MGGNGTVPHHAFHPIMRRSFRIRPDEKGDLRHTGKDFFQQGASDNAGRTRDKIVPHNAPLSYAFCFSICW